MISGKTRWGPQASCLVVKWANLDGSGRSSKRQICFWASVVRERCPTVPSLVARPDFHKLTVFPGFRGWSCLLMDLAKSFSGH